MKLKDLAEAIGVIAIVASLVFVGAQLRQTQDIAVAEGYSMLFATRIEVANGIRGHMDLWLRGTAGEELSAEEAAIFALLVNQLNESAVQGFLHTARVSGIDGALWNARDFAGFLYRNPGARSVWRTREDQRSRYLTLLGGAASSGTIWSEQVNAFLAELDRLAPPREGGAFPGWW